jgi:CBS domain-containing protein
MTTVRDMIRRKGTEVFAIDPDQAVYEALANMAKHNTGALLVVSGSHVAGIISERDCVRKIDLQGRIATATKVSEIMTVNVINIDASKDLEECMNIMINKNIRHLPVYDGDQLLGLISIRDVLREVVEYQKSLITQLEHYISGDGR